MSEDRRETGGLRLFIKAALRVGADAFIGPRAFPWGKVAAEHSEADGCGYGALNQLHSVPLCSPTLIRLALRLHQPRKERAADVPRV